MIMKKLLFIVFLFIYGITVGYSQDSQGGIPPSFGMKNISNNIDLVMVQPPDLVQLAAEDHDRASKSEPYRIGVTLPADFSLTNSGTWTDIPDQHARIWRLTVKSEGAKAIGFGYSYFHLPEGVKLFLYNKDKTGILGAYTSINNTSNNFFANEKLQGDEITLEMFIPDNIQESPLLHITELYFFYRAEEGSVNKSAGTCEVNVICSPEGDNWQDEKKGVCKIDIKNGSNWFNCTGSLVNNTSQDCTPYVLLADHCHYYNGSYSSSSDYNSWIFYFHYEASTCSGTSSSGTLTKTGCTLKAHDTYGSNDDGSDFCLVQINSAISSSYNVYYNGWDRNNTASSSGVGIHHPDGDIMKISTYTTALSSVNVGGTGTHWLVYWAATTNGHGVTEGGSSGSPIFNSTGKIVGTLTGGTSYCTSPNSPDYYGKVYYHWDQNGTTADKRLKDWLDPTNTGATTLAGISTCSSCTPPTTQATSFTSSSITNNSMTVGWTRGNGTGGVIVVARAGSAVNASPVNGTSYTANATFGIGTQLGTGNYVVYSGTGTSVNVTGLLSGIAYHYAIFEYTSTGYCYLTPALTGNATTTGSGGSTCDTLTNLLQSDNLALYGFTNQWGSWTGHNYYSFSEFAEYYTGVTTQNITGLEVGVAKAYSGGTGGNHKITFNVYQGGGSTPGTVLGSKDIYLSALTPNAINYVQFDTPVTFTGSDVYVGYKVYYNTPADTFAVYQAVSRTSLVNSGFVKYGTTWNSFPALSSNQLYSAIYVSPIVCTACTLPGAAGTITGSTAVCQGQNNVSYSVPAITGATNYTWAYSGTGATISGTTNAVTINFSSSATSGNLTVMGTNSCGNGTVSANYPVTVNVTPTVTVPSNFAVCNNGTVAATNFTSTPAGATYTWTNTNTAIGLAASGTGNIASFTAHNTGTSPITATIAVTPTLSGCAGSPSSYTITVNPTPTVTVPSNISVCNGGTVSATSFTSTPAGGTFSWTNSNTAIGLTSSGTGNVPSFTATNSGTSNITATLTVTPTVNSCVGTSSSYTITVKPTPTVTVPSNISVCNGGMVSATSFTSTPAGGTFSWTNSNTAIGLTSSGTGNVPSFTATNSGTSNITATITVTPTVNSCVGTSSSYTITVKPTPTVTVPSNISVCNGSTVSATSFTSTPAGGTFSWTNSNTAIGLTSSGSGNIPSFTATNTGTASISATITVTPTVNSCVGTPSSYTITVKPTPVVTAPSNITVCNNGIVPAVNFTSTPAGATFSWTNSNTTIGLAASGTGSIASFTAHNTGTSPILATILVTPTLNGCQGSPVYFVITVNPTPTVTVPSNITVCSGGTVTATNFLSTPAGGTYTWTNSNSALGLAFSGTGNIPSFTATNTGTSPIIATITVTPTVNNCTGTPSAYTITVNPRPVPTITGLPSVCAGATGVTYTTESSMTGYTWNVSAGGNITAGTGTNTITVSWTTVGLQTVTVNYSNGYDCAASSATIKDVQVYAVPIAEAGTSATYTGAPVSIGDPDNGPGTISWQPTSGLNNPAIAQPTASPSITTTYTLTVSNNNCTATDVVTVYVGGSGHVISGKTRYTGKANVGTVPNPPTYNAVIYDIDNVVVILKNYPAGTEVARDTSDLQGNYQFTNVADGNYILSYDKYAADTMQWCNDVNAVDIALLKYYIGVDTMVDPSRNFSAKYKNAGSVDNNTSINAVDIARIKAKIGAPYNVTKNFPKGNWAALDTMVTVAGSNLSITLKTISYGDFNASSTKYRDSTTNWSGLKSLPQDFIVSSDEYQVITNPSYFEVPLRISSKIDDFSALGLEAKYPESDFRLISAYVSGTGKNSPEIKINPSLDEIMTSDNDLLVTDENGVIRVVYATTHHFDVNPNDQILVLGFRTLKDPEPGEINFSLSGTGVAANRFGEENDGTYLLMPKIFFQASNSENGFDFTAYPNPFDDNVKLTYNIPENGMVTINIYNATGELVSELQNENQTGGTHTIAFSPKDLPAGIYTFRLDFLGAEKSNCMVLKLVH